MENTNQKTLNISLVPKTRITIDGDESRYIELNLSDMGLIGRINNLADRMSALSVEFADAKFDENMEEREQTEFVVQKIANIDKQMREIVDELFQAKVSDICVPDGTMFDMVNGEFVYEVLIEKLLQLYADNIGKETQKTMERIRKHTNKYIPQDHKKKS